MKALLVAWIHLAQSSGAASCSTAYPKKNRPASSQDKPSVANAHHFFLTVIYAPALHHIQSSRLVTLARQHFL